jgi:hypothetical protein
VRKPTLAKVEAWLAAAPAVEQPAPLAHPLGVVLAAKIDAFLAAHPNLAQVRVLAAMGMGATCLARFRRGDCLPTPARVARVDAVLAGPVLDDWVKKPKGAVRGRARPAPAQPDVAVARAFTAQRKRETAEAQRILDVNPDALAGRNNSITAAIGALRRQREADQRRSDPIEQAKLALRKRGRVVFDASVDGGRKGRFFVSGQTDPDTGKRRQLTPDDLTALAWKVNPTAMRELTGKERI